MIKDIDKNSIQKLIESNENVNFTGKVWFIRKDIFTSTYHKVYDKHTPLSYAIHANDKKIFLDLISMRADINCEIVPWDWLPIAYALKSSDSFFVKKILKMPNFDLYKKVKNKNIINHLISLSSLEEKSILKNISLLIKLMKSDKEFKFEVFLKKIHLLKLILTKKLH